jgi:hypothetical protein
VLNGMVRVSDAKREHVLKAIADLGYSQNMLSQGCGKEDRDEGGDRLPRLRRSGAEGRRAGATVDGGSLALAPRKVG